MGEDEVPAQGSTSSPRGVVPSVQSGYDTDKSKVYADDCLVTRVKENPVCISFKREVLAVSLTSSGLHRGDSG